jgi:hypothetical protein
MDSCGRETDRKKAKSILRWLERLDIPRSSSRSPGCCSICAPFHPCSEVIIGDRIETADSPGAREHWTKHFDSKTGPDGHCENKPIIRQVIAVLCTYDDQFLGKLVTKIASDQGGADLSVDMEARAWFERRILIRDVWFPNMLLVFETLVVAFYCRQNRRNQVQELTGFPTQPAGLAPPPMESDDDSVALFRWDNAEEVSHWEASIKWWIGKCSFCAGRGLRGANIQHRPRQCKRGGRAAVYSELGEVMYGDGLLPSNGCDICHLPHDLCNAWTRDNDGEWIPADTTCNLCQYGRYLLADTIIGLYYCGKSEYRQEIFEGVETYCEKNDLECAFDEETVACYLSQEISVIGVSGSEMVRILAILTQMVWDISKEN